MTKAELEGAEAPLAHPAGYATEVRHC